MIQLNFFLTSLLASPLGQLFLNVQRSTVHPFSTIYISTAYALLLLLSPSILHLSISHSGSLPLPKSPTTRTSNYCLTLLAPRRLTPSPPRHTNAYLSVQPSTLPYATQAPAPKSPMTIKSVVCPVQRENFPSPLCNLHYSECEWISLDLQNIDNPS